MINIAKYLLCTDKISPDNEPFEVSLQDSVYYKDNYTAVGNFAMDDTAMQKANTTHRNRASETRK